MYKIYFFSLCFIHVILDLKEDATLLMKVRLWNISKLEHFNMKT